MTKVRYCLFLSFFIVSFLQAEHFTYYADGGQDQVVHEKFFPNKMHGVFVDIGAHAGIRCSNTYFFEKTLQWTGICFEPNPKTYQELIRKRKCLCIEGAVSDKEGTDTFVCHRNSWVSGLLNKYNETHYKKWKLDTVIKDKNRIIQVKTYLLNHILLENDIKHVDLLSIDTEGGELDILKSIDFDRFFIDVIVVENIYDDPNYKTFLSSKGYQFITKCRRDEIYKKL